LQIPAILTDNFQSPYLEDSGLMTKFYKILSISKCSISILIIFDFLGLTIFFFSDFAFYSISSSINDIFANSFALNLGADGFLIKLSAVSYSVF